MNSNIVLCLLLNVIGPNQIITAILYLIFIKLSCKIKYYFLVNNVINVIKLLCILYTMIIKY